MQQVQEEYHGKILLVDDEINVCKGFQRLFEEEGYTAKYALSGTEGLEMAEDDTYDVVITDLKMPDISGIDVIRKIKESHPETPVIMITGYASVPTAVEAMKLGAEDYLSKPIMPNEILDAVHRAQVGVQKKLTDAGSGLGRSGKKAILKKKMSGGARIIDKKEVMAVLSRTVSDSRFWKDLMVRGSTALAEYNLSHEAKAAILSGDLNWVKKHIGDLPEDQLKWLLARMGMERW